MQQVCNCHVCNLRDNPYEEVDIESRTVNEYNSKPIPKTERATVLDVRDRLINVRDLVDICRAALMNDDAERTVRTDAANVLFFFVRNEIVTAEQELANV